MLMRRGYSLRISPDVLSDHILHKACLTRTGQPTGFADEVFNAFSKIAAERILRNLAELDWRLEKTGNTSTLLERIWENISRQFRRGSNFVRVVIIDWLQRTAVLSTGKKHWLWWNLLFIILRARAATKDYRSFINIHITTFSERFRE